MGEPAKESYFDVARAQLILPAMVLFVGAVFLEPFGHWLERLPFWAALMVRKLR
jgi:hypothetical protein